MTTREPLARILLQDGPVVLGGSVDDEAVASNGNVTVVADLELTNLHDLQSLAGRGGRGAEVILALYLQDDIRFLRRLHGGFAVAVWDRGRGELTVAVDRFGVKRLYYLSDASRTTFASRASALRLGPVAPSVSVRTVFHYLNFGFVPAPMSAFSGVTRLAPGHVLRVRGGHVTTEGYSDVEYPEQRINRSKSAASMVRFVEQGVSRALQGRPMKEVGAFLSGGTDSSTVVGLMSRLTGESVNAFSIGFNEPRYDELDYARLAATHFGAHHHTKIITADEALEALPRVVEAYDEPFGNDSAIGTYFCTRLARDCGVDLLLAGDGGDEIFGGNERYTSDRVFQLYQYVPGIVRRQLLEPVLRVIPPKVKIIDRAQRYVRRANIPNPRRFFSYEFLFVEEAQRLLAPALLQSLDLDEPYALTETHYQRARATSELNRLLYLDLKLAIGDNDLVKVTQAAELAGVQVRFPLLDPPLVNFTGLLPAHYKVRGFQKRYLFKRAFSDLLPPAIVAKRKHGFGVPTSTWIKSHRGFRELTRDTLGSTAAKARGYFRSGALEHLLDSHDAESSPYYGTILWRVLMLELWQLRHGDRAVAA